MNTNIKENMKNKSIGFYVGALGAVLALVTMFVYIGMDSMYFSALVILGLVFGIIAFAVGAMLDMPYLTILSYVCYLFALYHFLVLEVNFRMDTFVDPAQGAGAIDGIFWTATVFFIISIVATIVSSCMKQSKTEK